MAPKAKKGGKKKAEVIEDKIEVHDAVVDNGVKAKKVIKVTKVPKKGEEKSKEFENGVNGSGDPQEKTESEDGRVEPASGSDVPTNDKVASKRRQKPAKTKAKEESAEDEDKKESTKVEEESSLKDLPAKRGRRAAQVKAVTNMQNGIDSIKDEDNCESKTDVEVKDVTRPKRKGKVDVVPSNSVKDQNKPEPKETKAKTTRKAKVQPKENSVEKEVPSKEPARKRKNAVEKTESKATKKVKDNNPPEMDKNRQLRVAIKRNETLDEMAKKQMEDDAEANEELKAKNMKGPAKGKGKRAAKDNSEGTQPPKKPKENTSKSKGVPKKEKDKIPDVTALDFENKSKTADGKLWNLKMATWNVNGLRAWLQKNGMSYLHHEKPDIMCIQETKCSDDKLPPEVNVEGYHCYWLSGDKDGYSGVGLMSKKKPLSVQYGINMEKHDKEGRVITAEYDDFYLVTTYIPNAGRELVRLEYRQEWDVDFRSYLKKLDEKKPVVLCGDLNVAHEEIDLANPKPNKRNAGFTQEERDGFSALLSEGFVDTFRRLYPDQKGAYTFWTYMSNSRAKNVGWRLDYFVISERLANHLCDSVIRKDVYGSDHCPVTLFLHV